MTATADRIMAFIVDEVNPAAAGELGPDTDLLLTGLVDSLGVVRIVNWMEDELAVEVDPVDVTLENFQTVAAMAAYVASREGPGAAP